MRIFSFAKRNNMSSAKKKQVDVPLAHLSYMHLAPGEVFFRSKTDPRDPRVEINHPFQRGIYVTDDPSVACTYAFQEKEHLLEEYRLVQPVMMLGITWENMKVLTEILESIPRIPLRNGATITSKQAIDIVRRYSAFRKSPKQPLTIHTSDDGRHEAHGGKSDYLGHWFAHIVCFLGFQGYHVGKGYRRRNTNVMFHPEYYFCSPRLHLQVAKYTHKCVLKPS